MHCLCNCWSGVGMTLLPVLCDLIHSEAFQLFTWKYTKTSFAKAESSAESQMIADTLPSILAIRFDSLKLYFH